jgi:hypothetical protein
MARLDPANGEGSIYTAASCAAVSAQAGGSVVREKKSAIGRQFRREDEVTRAAVFAIFVAAIAAAQQDTPSPTFSAAIKLVEVDVVARSQGAPATGPTKDDFTLLDNGKPQKIAFFSVQSGRVAAPPGADVALLPAGVVSNRSEPEGHPTGNTSVVFLDQRNTPMPDQAFAIQRIAKFIATRGPQDRTGIYTFGRDGSLKVVQEITSDSELLSRAAASLKAQDPEFRSPDVSGLEGKGGRGLSPTRQKWAAPPGLKRITRRWRSCGGR